MRVLIPLLLLVPALAGCTGAPAGDALDLRGRAESTAAGLDPTAELMGVFGAEWTDLGFGEEFTGGSPEAEALDQGIDRTPGDGRANAWGYLFRGADPLMVVLAADGKLLHAGVLPEDSGFNEDYGSEVPLGSASVGSEAAAATLREDERFAALLEQDHVVVIMALGRDADSDTPFWVFTAFHTDGEDEDDFFLGIVDAQTGERVNLPWFG